MAGSFLRRAATSLRYLRRRSKKIAVIAEVRKQSRVGDDGGTA
jgi:hypothetical protein